MSQSLISHSKDLRRLRDEGYEIEVRANYLLVHAVPYLDAQGNLAFGTLCSELTLASPLQTAPPSTHVAHFIGQFPHNADGSRISAIEHGSGPFRWAEDLAPDFSFSNKPRTGSFSDYFEKMTSYIDVIWHQARAKYPDVDPRTYKVVESAERESVFEYEDTASSRAGIQPIAMKLQQYKIAIIGLGGTGAYILDLLAKTHVAEIHLYDADALRQHNAFRSPGAVPRVALEQQSSKVGYFAQMYSHLRRGIVGHPVYVTEANAGELTQFDFVFICVDKGTARQTLINSLRATQVAFIDVGMDVQMTDDAHQLWGICRVTTSTPTKRDHLAVRVSTSDREGEGLYATNIQVADLNALNVILAVIRWKRLCGYYLDDSGDYDCTFTTSLNKIANAASIRPSVRRVHPRSARRRRTLRVHGLCHRDAPVCMWLRQGSGYSVIADRLEADFRWRDGIARPFDRQLVFPLPIALFHPQRCRPLGCRHDPSRDRAWTCRRPRGEDEALCQPGSICGDSE